DPYKMQRVKAFVVLKPGIEPSEEVRAELMTYCQEHIAKYAMPTEIEFRAELPKTLVARWPTASLRRRRKPAPRVKGDGSGQASDLGAGRLSRRGHPGGHRHPPAL